MKLSARLWEAQREAAARILAHPFVQGLADGTLPRAKFVAYMAQDALFLDAFLRAYALALAKVPDREGQHTLYTLMGGVLDELKLHQAYAREWGFPLEVTPHPATLHYTDFLLRTAALEDPGAILAAMTPCMRLYAYLGQSLRADLVPDSPYRGWVETYASEEFEALAQTLESLLNRYGQDTPILRERYAWAIQLEEAFFDAFWKGGTA